MKLVKISFASILFVTASFAQIPITSADKTPPTPPQPTLVVCPSTASASLVNSNWAFNDIGDSVAQIGTFTILPGGQVTGQRTTNSLGTLLERRGAFWGQIDFGCVQGTNVVAAGTLQLGGALGGQIFTYSFPITASLVNGVYVYTVTSTTTMNLRRYGALDPVFNGKGTTNNTNGYAYNGTSASSGTAVRITNPLPCPDPAELALDVFAPNGYKITPSMPTPFPDNIALPGSLKFTAAGSRRGGGGTVSGNIAVPAIKLMQATPFDIGAYQVDFGCATFTMNFPFIRDGQIVGGNFDGVVAAGDFSRFYILGENNDGPGFTGVKQ